MAKVVAGLVGVAVTAAVAAALAALDAHDKRPAALPAIGDNGGPPIGAEPLYTIETFCKAHKISRRLLYSLWKENRGPQITRLGRSVRISRQAAAAWRREREAAGEG